MQLASARVKALLESYEQPAMDPATSEALGDFVARRKAAMPDAFL